MISSELKEALDVVRALLATARSGHSLFCCQQNKVRANAYLIKPEQCLCPTPKRNALALLRKYSVRT